MTLRPLSDLLGSYEETMICDNQSNGSLLEPEGGEL